MFPVIEQGPNSPSMHTNVLAGPSLPNELADLVVYHCPRETLFVCSLVSRYWASSSRSHLFETIILRPDPTETEDIRSLLASPHNTISGSIRRLHLNTFSYQYGQVDCTPIVKALVDAGAARTITALTLQKIWNLRTIQEIPHLLPHMRCVGWGDPSPLTLMEILPWLQQFKQLETAGFQPAVGRRWPRDLSTEDLSWSTNPDTLLVTRLVLAESELGSIRGNQLIQLRTPNLSSLYVPISATRIFEWGMYRSFLRQSASTLKELQMTFYRTAPLVLNVQLDLAELRNLQTLSFIVYDRIIDDSHMRKILYSIPHTLENIRLVFHRTNPLSVFQSQDDSFLPLPSLTPAQLPSLSKFEICVPQLHADMIQPIEALWPEWRDREVLIVRLVTDEDDSHS